MAKPNTMQVTSAGFMGGSSRKGILGKRWGFSFCGVIFFR